MMAIIPASARELAPALGYKMASLQPSESACCRSAAVAKPSRSNVRITSRVR